MAGGKRIRPQLMTLTYDAFMQRVDETQDSLIPPVPREITLIFACALEMIHTYSLIHDDLPAMDDDSLRRGRPTVHVAFGEDIAILAGDGLLNLAFEVAGQAMEIYPGERRVEQAVRILARKPGLFGMLGGQTADVTLAGTKLDDEQLEYIYANKTAALLECAMQIGAVLGGATPEEVEVIRKAAYDVGIAFQVQDDILDEIGDAATLGKEVGQDARNEKTTYVTLHGMEAAEEYVRTKTDEANRMLRQLFPDEEGKSIGTAAEELIALLQSLVGRNS
jgi:geranylgeranyl diphosphate synthase type II